MSTSRQPIKILAISGSLKTSSVNTSLLHNFSALMESTDQYRFYEEMEGLPAFNPDKEEGNLAIKNFKRQLKEADGVVISTPEYAFGLPGVLKNALDWTVHSGDLNAKPVAVISASPLSTGGEKAMASLLLTLGALGTITPPELTLSIPDVLKKMNAERQLSDEATLLKLKQVADGLVKAIHENTLTSVQ